MVSPPVPVPVPVPPTDHNEDFEPNKWAPFESRADFNLDASLLLIFILCFVIVAIAFNFCVSRLVGKYSNTEKGSQLKLQEIAKSSGPTLEFSSGLKLAGNEAVCAICLSDFVNGEGIRVLSKCNHGFHVNCIERWLLSSHTSCPTCRTSCINIINISPSPPPENNHTADFHGGGGGGGGDLDDDVESGTAAELPILGHQQSTSGGRSDDQ